MNPAAQFRFALAALTGHKMRTILMLIAMAIGVASVVVLTALGEGARRYVVGEFASLGTNLIIVLPGKSETSGGPPPLTGVSPRDLTIADADALTRSPSIRHAAPVVVGAAPVATGGLEREVLVLGSTAAMRPVRHLAMAEGRFIPEGDPKRGPPVAVLGATLRQELFGNKRAVGEQLRIGDRRFRVIGVLEDAGHSLGVDLNDLVVIPVSQAQALLNMPSLFRVLVQSKGPAAVEPAKNDILSIIKRRHEGDEDVTVITQDAVMGTFDAILGALTLAVAGIAGISLVVAGILVMNVMLVSVSQRTAEIGLLKALGAAPRVVLGLFLAEAALLAICGALLGLVVGYGGVALLTRFIPDFPAGAPLWAVAASLVVAVGTGLVFGAWPARRAARLDPVQALARR